MFAALTIDPEPLRTTVHSDNAIAAMGSRIEGAVAEILSDTTTLTTIGDYARDEDLRQARKVVKRSRGTWSTIEVGLSPDEAEQTMQVPAVHSHPDPGTLAPRVTTRRAAAPMSEQVKTANDPPPF
ncbi:hypothetical protein [Rhodococcus sp. NPDC059234]|uniref:hypothetical protein n=1 Tax=Rhodococcus sp. NPDC059234 TaxID=3346781 RepID=UPI0036712D9D